MSCFSSAFFVIMAGFWVYTIIDLANFLDNFEVVYSLYLAIELIACLFLILFIDHHCAILAIPAVLSVVDISVNPKQQIIQSLCKS